MVTTQTTALARKRRWVLSLCSPSFSTKPLLFADKEITMEAEQEEEKEIQLDLHCPPVYPLPEEINRMEHSETVCHYCGVSYLIFHEFHQLQTRLAQQETELQELKGTMQREKAQRDALELEKQEWKRALQLEVLREAGENEKRVREELEEKNKEAEKALRKAFEKKSEREKRELEEVYQKIGEEKERQLRGELRDLEAENLRKQREELQRRTEEREKVLSDALQKANKNVDELKKYLQHLEERLTAATSTKETAEQLLGEQRQMGEMLRAVCMRQQRTLRATLSVLRSTGSELTDVRGFLNQLMEAWQPFSSQILQYSTQVFSALREKLRNSSEDVRKTRDENDQITQQLMRLQKQKILSDEQLSQLEDTEKEHRQQLQRLKAELEEKHEMWLSCQQKCDAIQEQLLSWQQEKEQMARKCYAAEEEVMRLKKTLVKVQHETGELRIEREGLLESHSRVLTKMEEDFRQEMTSKLEEREQELQQLKEELQQGRRSREEERRMQEQERRRTQKQMRQELHCFQQQEALKLSQTNAEMQLMTQRNTELQEEVAVLQETVRRECEEREELTAALSKAQEELLGLRSPVPCPRSPPSPMEKHTPTRNKQSRVPLSRSSASPNTLRCFPSGMEKDTGGGGAVRSLEPWNCGGVLDGEKQQRGTLPRLKLSNTANEVKLSQVMGERLG